MNARSVSDETPTDLVMSGREWLLTNGLGGFAMGRGIGPNDSSHTRRYHGMLIAATRPPVGRVIALHSIFDQLRSGDETTELATAAFSADPTPVLHPNGWQCLTDTKIVPPHEATWTFEINAERITRSLRLLRGSNIAEITWQRTAGDDAEPMVLSARPLTPLRDFHELGHRNDPPPKVKQLDDRTLEVRREALTLHLTLSHGRWDDEPQWWHDFYYADDADRGQSCHEDIWSPARFLAELGSEPVTLRAELLTPGTPALCSPVPVQSSCLASRLCVAADQFVVKRHMRDDWSTSIIAGYPWFSDWGRDTMICLPGMMLCGGDDQLELARSTLMTFAQHLRDGLIPNRFDDYAGAAHYNTVDASLWFVHAVYTLQQKCGRSDGVLVESCRSIIHAYRSGTRYDIAMGDDGLIRAGSPTTQLTWMDAQRNGVTFTPRHGKAIEINALWHHALHCMAAMTDGAEARSCTQLAQRVAQSIQRQFWNQTCQCCFDVLTPDGDGWGADAAIRPNQLFAVSLAPSPLSEDQQRSVVAVARECLLTPFGLRTLDPADAQYRGRYEGNLMQRDAAYHQGTVWPWLIGVYAEAVLRSEQCSAVAREHIRDVLAPLNAELDRGCFNQLAEVYDGDAPHRPSGCPAQAWSVAELMRANWMLQQSHLPA